jgi:4-amino-4-deoxy-L-arabinose transferase-like glycosyltransferase
MVPPTTRRWLGAILAVAAIVRIGWCVYAARPPATLTAAGGVSLHDPNFYMYFADQIAHGNGYRLPDNTPSAYYPVGYIAVLSALFFMTDHTIGEHQVGVVAVLNIICGVATVLFVFAIGRRLAGDRVGLVAAAITAVYPNLVFHTAAPLTETLFNALFTLTIYLAIAGPWREHRFERWRLLLLGLLVGVCTLVRPVTLPILVVLGVAWLLFGFGWRRALTHAALVTVIALVTIAPWIIRNAHTMHAAVLSTNTGDNMCMSRHVGGSGAFELPNDRCNTAPFDGESRPAYEVDRDAQGRRLALDFIRDHPTDEVKQWVKRVYHTFTSDDDGLTAVESYGDNAFIGHNLRRALSDTANVFFDVTVLLSLVAVPIVLRRREPGWFIVALIVPATVILPVLATFGDVRFHVPGLPFFALLAAVPIVAIGERIARRRVTEPS